MPRHSELVYLRRQYLAHVQRHESDRHNCCHVAVVCRASGPKPLESEGAAMSFNTQERERLAALADVLIPAARGHLSASQADVAGDGLDQVLTTCPEMV